MTLLCGQDIPQEIINTIVNHLADDKPSLTSCSIVSSAFLDPCQRGIFYSLPLRVDDSNHNLAPVSARRLIGLLQPQSYKFLEYVRVLHIHIKQCYYLPPCFIDLLSRLTNLTETVVYGNDDSSLSKDLIRLCCKPTITHLTINNPPDFPGPWHYIRQCQSLKCLVVNFAPLPSSNPSVEHPLAPSVSLRSLYLSGHFPTATLLHWAQDPFCPLRLQNLTALGIVLMDHGTTQIETLQRLLPMLYNLETLAIGPSTDFSRNVMRVQTTSSETLLDLSCLPRLKRLILSTNEDISSTYFYWITAQLCAVPKANNIQEFHLISSSPCINTMDSFKLKAVSQRWKMLDDVLAQPNFDDLKFVCLHFDFWSFGDEKPIKKVVKLVDKTMARAKENKEVIVKKLDEEYWFHDVNHTPVTRPLTWFSPKFLL